ncbi:hypothetical protein [Mycobacterium sp. 3519A]|uniref:WXG100-like domain-containing protein n=1 Tax=Mycobacterium sp. 3519A TaxID=2057184 RepID=UPI00115A2567|nr:hypothetical protein [Mycobacterium sp. 3519A]
MGIEMPPELQWLSYLAGSSWPQGDETQLFSMSEVFKTAADELRDLVPELSKVRRETLSVLVGDTADAADKQFRMLFDGDYSVEKLADAVDELGGLSYKTGGEQIEYNKLVVISTLAVTAFFIFLYIAEASITDGFSLTWIPPLEQLTAASLRKALEEALARLWASLVEATTKTGVRKLAREVSEEVVEETVTELVQEFAIEKYQAGKGHRHGVDWGAVGKNAFSGAAGGAGGAAAHRPVSEVVGHHESLVGKVVKGGVTQFSTGVVGNVTGSLAGGGGLSALSILGGSSSSALEGTFHAVSQATRPVGAARATPSLLPGRATVTAAQPAPASVAAAVLLVPATRLAVPDRAPARVLSPAPARIDVWVLIRAVIVMPVITQPMVA